MMIVKLTPDEIYKKCDPFIFSHETTDTMEEFTGTIGQKRALQALEFGLNMNTTGFNIFAIGETGTGRMSTIISLLKEKASKEKVPDDWCYVYNFKDPDAPIAISLQAGMGVVLQKEMEELVNILKIEIPKAFESKEYEMQKNKIIEEFQQKQAEYFSRLDEEAKTRGFAVRRGPTGVLIVPVKENGELLTKEEFEALDEKARRQLEDTGRMFQERLNDVVRVLKDAERIVRDMLMKLEKMIALEIVGPLIEGLKTKYRGNDKLLAYFEDVKEEIVAHIEEFKVRGDEQPSPFPFLKMTPSPSSLSKYSVNVFVNNGETKGAPVVIENNPSYLNLFGRIEFKVSYGVATTDFTLIKPGSVHKANGGYLILNATDLLKNPFSYDALKRSLKNREIRIEDILEQYRLISMSTLKPEPIPLDIKVILISNPQLYYLLYWYDEESRGLFKVKADFDNIMDRTEENMEKYMAFVARCQKEENLLPFDRTAVARIVEIGSRLADHQNKLSMRFSDIADLIRESSYWASMEGTKTVTSTHVTRAVEEKIYRTARIKERLDEMVLEGTIIVETEGKKTGQVNGLAVIDLGDFRFGKPSRITAKTFTGRAGVVNIERETKMSGKIHEKAIMIISSYLGSKYAIKSPISLSASITFEQLYEMVEGDSATCAELYALLSSISGVPLKQGIAVTGSMDQNGDVQPIGGVNEKIEGFFDICKARGLDGSHGVIIPKKNIVHLMLKEEVQNAVREGLFTIYGIDKMEEGLEILTDMKAGEPDGNGDYPEGTINYLVTKRLTEISEAMEKRKDKKSEEENQKEKREEDESEKVCC
ncbi:MAG: AAA family ATPase [Syntrophorhabdaceae bacterium]|nr:AAA family ATPase [Syntrophorhabdaceae bacterium]